MTTQELNDYAVAEANKGLEVTETFTMQYLLDGGVQVQLLEAIARELFGQHVSDGGSVPEDAAQSPKEMLSAAVNDIVDTGSLFSPPVFSLKRVIDGAASLEFLVRYARKVNPAVLPPEVIPSDDVVKAALRLFHQHKQQPAATS